MDSQKGPLQTSFEGMCKECFIEYAPEVQKEAMKVAFYTGAHFLYTKAFNTSIPREERQIALNSIQNELNAFIKEMKEKAGL